MRRWRRSRWGMMLLLVWSMDGRALADNGHFDPGSRIQRPPGRGVTYLVAAGAAGQLGSGNSVQPGYSVSVIFRPHRAADFQNAFYARNTGLVLQVDKQGDDAASILSGDLVVRRYMGDMRPLAAGRAVFAGIGAGISRAQWSSEGAMTGGSAENFSFLAETGLEWNLNRTLVLMAKGQYRLYKRGGRDHSGWSAHLGAGLPLPF